MSGDAKFQVGQTIFAESRSHPISDLIEFQITTIGRKWIGFGRDGRFDKDTMVIDNGGIGFSRRVWTTREEYEARRARRQAWDELRRAIDRLHIAPDHLTVEQIRAMSAAFQQGAPDHG